MKVLVGNGEPGSVVLGRLRRSHFKAIGSRSADVVWVDVPDQATMQRLRKWCDYHGGGAWRRLTDYLDGVYSWRFFETLGKRWR